MSQTHEILEALKAGDKLTHLEAERRFNCARLAARIDESGRWVSPFQP